MRIENYSNINDEIVAIRKEVFMDEQGILFEDEFEGGEETYIHFCLYNENVLVGYIRLTVVDCTLHIGRVAVKKEFRKKGLGRILMKTAEEYGVNNGCLEITLNAQLHAKGFYQKLGYTAWGDEFLEARIKHIKMTKKV